LTEQIVACGVRRQPRPFLIDLQGISGEHKYRRYIGHHNAHLANSAKKRPVGKAAAGPDVQEAKTA
jgi:hypothetical protein